ncbi:hypothetical protein [Rhizobium sp. BK379]|uniref:hypothetical protein n=1 Tax=Rhizobium sp. BK379 TaxID=2587059 RepID=UPI001FED3169|nr:hypothetical protein [Rhizobium sp. BK379]
MGLVRLQGLKPETVQRLNDRILAMAAVHEQMYGSISSTASTPASSSRPFRARWSGCTSKLSISSSNLTISRSMPKRRRPLRFC